MDPEAVARIVTEIIEEKRHSLQEKQRRARQWQFALEVTAIEAQLAVLNDVEAEILQRVTEG
jgi:hypothetical protein